MNNKILINVTLPSIELNYDIYVPISKSINVLIKLIIEGINDINDNILDNKNKYVLLNENGEQLDLSKSLKELNIKNGDILYLI